MNYTKLIWYELYYTVLYCRTNGGFRGFLPSKTPINFFSLLAKIIVKKFGYLTKNQYLCNVKWEKREEVVQTSAMPNVLLITMFRRFVFQDVFHGVVFSDRWWHRTGTTYDEFLFFPYLSISSWLGLSVKVTPNLFFYYVLAFFYYSLKISLLSDFFDWGGQLTTPKEKTPQWGSKVPNLASQWIGL